MTIVCFMYKAVGKTLDRVGSVKEYNVPISCCYLLAKASTSHHRLNHCVAHNPKVKEGVCIHWEQETGAFDLHVRLQRLAQN